MYIQYTCVYVRYTRCYHDYAYFRIVRPTLPSCEETACYRVAYYNKSCTDVRLNETEDNDVNTDTDVRTACRLVGANTHLYASAGGGRIVIIIVSRTPTERRRGGEGP